MRTAEQAGARPEAVGQAVAVVLLSPHADALGALAHEAAARHGAQRVPGLRRLIRPAGANRLLEAARWCVLVLLTTLVLWIGLVGAAVGFQALARGQEDPWWTAIDPSSTVCGADQIHVRNLVALGVIALASTLCSILWNRESFVRAMGGATALTLSVALIARPSEGCGVEGFQDIGPALSWQVAAAPGVPLIVSGVALTAASVAMYVIWALADHWDIP